MTCELFAATRARHRPKPLDPGGDRDIGTLRVDRRATPRP